MLKYALTAFFAVMILCACASKEYTGPTVTDCSTLQGDMKQKCLENNGVGNFNVPVNSQRPRLNRGF